MVRNDVGGYVLAGGKSSRMGQNKALLKLAGKPLVQHAVVKLSRMCADVHVLSNRPELEAFAPLIPDLHEECGPMSGLEAGLAQSRHEWNLFMPVDVPFLPSAFLDQWVGIVVARENGSTRVALFTVGGVPQPLFCLLHREVQPFVREAIQGGRYKVFPVLESAAKELAARQGWVVDRTFFNISWDENVEIFSDGGGGKGEAWSELTGEQRAIKHLWFANLNTPEEFAEAERYEAALDT